MATPSNLGIQVEEDGPYFNIAHLKIARTAFVGRTLRGPVNRPVLIKSFAEFQALFGGLWQPSPMGYALEQYFDNGGREATVVRVVNGARSATLALKAGSGRLLLRAVRPGTREFLRASVDYDNIAVNDSARFNLTVQRVRIQGSASIEDQEIFPRLSVLSAEEGDVRRAFADSELVALEGDVPECRPDRTMDPQSGLAIGYVHSNSDGDDGAPISDYDVIGSRVEHTGLFALSLGEDFNFLCIPPLARDQDVGISTWLVAARYCRQRRALLIVDPPAAWHTADEALRGMSDWQLASEDTVMFFPRVMAHDKLRGHYQCFAPSAAVAGILGRAEDRTSLWNAGQPQEAILRPGFRPSCLVPEDRRVRLATAGINTLLGKRSATRTDLKWRTLARGMASSAEAQYLQSRRFVLYVLNCVERSTRWVMFSHATQATAEAVAARVGAFFESLHDQGAFGTRSMADSFSVITDARADQDTPAAAMATEPHHSFKFLIGFSGMRSGQLHGFRIMHTLAGAVISPASLSLSELGSLHPLDAQWVETLATPLRS